jgi:hypothetical protein
MTYANVRPNLPRIFTRPIDTPPATQLHSYHKPGAEFFPGRRGIEEKRKKVQAVPDNIAGRGDGRAWCPACGPEESGKLSPKS